MQSAKMQKSALYSVEIFVFCCRTRNNNDVFSLLQSVFIQPETFPYQTDKPVSYYAVSYFPAYGNSNSRILFVRIQHIHNQVLVGIRYSVFIYFLKIAVFLYGMKPFHLIPLKDNASSYETKDVRVKNL